MRQHLVAVQAAARISGGTPNPMAPPAQFLQRAYCRLLAAMGAQVDIDLVRAGFYPAGGGIVVATIAPCPQLKQIALMEPGRLTASYAEAFVAGIPVSRPSTWMGKSAAPAS